MFYAKVNPDGSLERYPYTLTDLRLANKNTSWPDNLTEETIVDFGVYPVEPSPRPSDHYTYDLVRTAIKNGNSWVEQWEQIPATPEQIALRTENKAQEIRNERNQKLKDSDWTQLEDSPFDANTKENWRLYRAALREIPQQQSFPWDAQWPQEP